MFFLRIDLQLSPQELTFVTCQEQNGRRTDGDTDDGEQVGARAAGGTGYGSAPAGRG